MLSYVLDGFRGCKADEVCFVPTAIAYDEVSEVGDYVREQLGEEKRRESFSFLVRMVRSLSNRHLGRIYIRFAEPISLRRHLERAGDDPLVVERLAFQIANRINAVTPLTAVAAVSSVFLGAGRRGLTRAALEDETQRLVDYAGEHGIPLGRELEQGAKVGVATAIEALRSSGVMGVYDGGVETVYTIGLEQRHVASFYRNTTAHFFLSRSIAALAAETALTSTPPLETWALRLRELLKFEFFFGDRADFLRDVERESRELERESAAGVPPLGAAGPRLVLDYLESYWVVMRTLQTLPADATRLAERELLRRCLAIGHQLLLQDQVAARELLSNVNFKNALLLAQNLRAAHHGPDGWEPGDRAALGALADDLETLAGAARNHA
jgi:glycerol-3-phosphate O-acyltransferase